MGFKSLPLAILSLVALTFACGTTKSGDDSTASGGMGMGMGTTGPGSTSGDASSTSTSGGPTTAPTSGSATSSTSGGGTSGAGSNSSGATSGSFVEEPDAGDVGQCDPLEQDCPDGEKCTAWANDGGNVWNANKCVPVSGNNQPGDPCQIEGSGVSGFDDCAKGGICLFGNEEGIGICMAFCEGADQNCPGNDPCVVTNDGTLPLCLEGCDPLLQDCSGSEGCYDSPGGLFGCFADASGASGLDGDVCPPSDGENTCDPGLWCGPGSSGCTTVNCCTPYCDLSAPSCTSPDECISFYGDAGNAPPGLEDVGVCLLP